MAYDIKAIEFIYGGSDNVNIGENDILGIQIITLDRPLLMMEELMNIIFLINIMVFL